jgi:transcriptional regulator with XRE-family HTH domain
MVSPQQKSATKVMKMRPTPSGIRQNLQDRGISVRAVATRMGIHPGHLQRVLSGKRAGSRKFLKSIADEIKGMPDRRHQRQDEVERLIDAATHMFFLKRGDFESAIFLRGSRKKEEE